MSVSIATTPSAVPIENEPVIKSKLAAWDQGDESPVAPETGPPPEVYDKYDMGVIWSDANNLEAIKSRLSVYQCASTPNADRTYSDGTNELGVTDYSIIHAVSTALVPAHVKARSSYDGALAVNVGTPFSNITDGTSNTILMYEDAGRQFYYRSGKYVTSVAPDYDDGGNLALVGGLVQGGAWADKSNVILLHGMSYDGATATGPCAVNCTNNNEPYSFHPGIMQVTLCDGSVRTINENIEMDAFVSLSTRSGGEVIPTGSL